VDCAGLSFTYAGRVTDATPGEVDGRSVLFLVDTGWTSEASLVSAPFVTADGPAIIDADVALNGVGYAWAVDGADGRTRMDVQASMTHEIGHMLGLWHSTVADATLNPMLDGNPDARDLAVDDVEGLCALYGLGSGEGTQGEPCVTTDDCDATLLCLVDGAESYCTATCDDAECPAGYECLEAEAQSVCAVAAGDTGCGCDTGSGTGGWLAAVLTLGMAARRSRRG
jgi:MYXO-CTERM domain-containing protein